MSKLSILLSAGALALTPVGFAAAAGDGQNGRQPQARQPDDQAAGGATAARREREYLEAVKQCGRLTGADKTRCVEAARTRYGQM